MTLRRGRKRPHVEPPRADELPAGLPADAGALSRDATGERGRFAEGNARASLGGRARAGSTRLAARLGLAELPAGADFAPYRRAAVAFRRAQCTTLASTVGGGMCGPGPSSIVASAALALAWSRYLSDVAARTGDAELATRAARLGVESRQHLLAAHELCAREAAARPRQPTWVLPPLPPAPAEQPELDDDDDEQDTENAEGGEEGISTAAARGGEPADFSEPPGEPPEGDVSRTSHAPAAAPHMPVPGALVYAPKLGRFVRAGEPTELRRAEAPKDLDAKVAALREQHELDQLRNGR